MAFWHDLLIYIQQNNICEAFLSLFYIIKRINKIRKHYMLATVSVYKFNALMFINKPSHWPHAIMETTLATKISKLTPPSAFRWLQILVKPFWADFVLKSFLAIITPIKTVEYMLAVSIVTQCSGQIIRRKISLCQLAANSAKLNPICEWINTFGWAKLTPSKSFVRLITHHDFYMSFLFIFGSREKLAAKARLCLCR